MIRYAIILAALTAAPALAESPQAVTTFAAAPVEHEGELGTLTIRNLVADLWGHQGPVSFVIATPHGDVVVAYTPVRNDDLDPSDIVTVTAPDGYLAIPSDFRVDENATVDVRIIQFSGV